MNQLNLLSLSLLSLLNALNASAGDWPGWRGPTHDGQAASGQRVPVRWGNTLNLLWKVPVPGRGHASPTVVGDRDYLPTADEEKEIQSVLCFDRQTGRQLWRTDLHQGGFPVKGHRRKSHASSSAAWDGERLFVNFLSGGAVHTSALDADGNPLWTAKITDYVIHQGYGSSPFVHGELVIVAADNKGGGTVAGLDRKTGRVVWRVERPATPNYPSPVVYRVGGRDQLFLSGCDHVSSLDPRTGRKLWEIEESTTECVVTIVTDGERIFTGGGYPRNHTVAVVADGSGKVAWHNTTRVYVPSMLVKDGHLFATTDSGMAVCWDSATGREIWKERLGGDFFASPVMLDGRIYATNIRGVTYVFDTGPAGFKLLAENPLGDESYASPVICGDSIYLRIAEKQGDLRREFLCRIGSGR